MLGVANFVVAVIVGALALWAQWARKNRAAEISLWVVLLALSLLAAAVGGLMVVLSLSGAVPASVLPPELLRIEAAGVTAAGIIGLALCVPPLLKILGRPPRHSFWSDPPIFFGLWIFVMVLLPNNLVGILGFQQMSKLSSVAIETGGRVSPALVLSTEIPFIIVALCGVGFGVRRGPRETLARLGYRRITLRQIGAAALFVAAALTLTHYAEQLFSYLQPGLAHHVGGLTSNLFGTKGLSPASVVLFGLLVGIGAALGEETLFRGAVQPVLGIPLTSVLFASMHFEYGPSVLLVYLFLVSIGLGILRKRANTTTSFLAHAAYNALGVILPYFISKGI